MTVPKPPPYDANAANNAWRSIKKADGSSYAVFLNTAYPDFIKWVRSQRDHLEALRLGVFGTDGVKAHLDALDDREATHHQAQAARLTALEDAIANPPFPG
jgi:hypothetical protein